jgi:hypothetical protein
MRVLKLGDTVENAQDHVSSKPIDPIEGTEAAGHIAQRE